MTKKELINRIILTCMGTGCPLTPEQIDGINGMTIKNINKYMPLICRGFADVALDPDANPDAALQAQHAYEEQAITALNG